MAARGHFVFSIDAKNHKVLVIWDLNGYGEYEFDWGICDNVMALQALACGGGGTKNIIFPNFFQISENDYYYHGCRSMFYPLSIASRRALVVRHWTTQHWAILSN